MDWKKVFTSLAIFAVGAATLAAVAFYAIDTLRIARGLKPVLLKAPQDMTELLPPTGGRAVVEEKEGKNETGMPLQLPDGFSISIFAKDLGAPRVMMWGPDGNLWTSIPSQGKVVALRDANGDGVAEEAMTVLDGNGKEIAVGIAQAEKEWMTTDFVPFSATLTFAKPSTEKGAFVFEKDNPSGLPEHADALRIPIVFGE